MWHRGQRSSRKVTSFNLRNNWEHLCEESNRLTLSNPSTHSFLEQSTETSAVQWSPVEDWLYLAALCGLDSKKKVTLWEIIAAGKASSQAQNMKHSTQMLWGQCLPSEQVWSRLEHHRDVCYCVTVEMVRSKWQQKEYCLIATIGRCLHHQMYLCITAIVTAVNPPFCIKAAC